MTTFTLQFDAGWIPELAARYNYAGEHAFIEHVVMPARAREWLTADEFVELVRWKTRGRSVPAFLRNERSAMERASCIACARVTRPSERIATLLALEGVGYPVASVVLHFVCRARYPILDRRARASLGDVRQRTTYTDAFWRQYVRTCRALATENGVTMRTLDRALWVWPALRDRDRYRQPPPPAASSGARR